MTNEKEMKRLEREIKFYKEFEKLNVGDTFLAKDMGVAGMTIKSLMYHNEFEVVGTQKSLYQVDENTTKEVEVKIYKKLKPQTLKKAMQYEIDILNYEMNMILKEIEVLFNEINDKQEVINMLYDL